jgi:hypothetical protein
MERKMDISRKGALEMGGLAILVLSGCERVVSSFVATPTVEDTPTFTVKATETQTPTPKVTNTPEATNTPTVTSTPEVFDWNHVSKRTDEEIFDDIGVPNPEDFELKEELQPDKILRNEEGQSYALFKNEAGIDLLAENLETKEVEHAIYAEYPGGVPVLLLTDKSVVDGDGGWFKLNEDYGEVEARDLFGEAFNRALAMRWWNQEHPMDYRGTDYRYMNSLDEIPGYSRDMMGCKLTNFYIPISPSSHQ